MDCRAIRIRFTVAFLFGCSMSGTAAWAKDSRYCGLYCAAAAIQSMGVPCDVGSIVVPENMSGQSGSTAADLLRVFSEHGVDAHFAPRSSWDAVRQAQSPVLLHTRSIASDHYSHWILYLGRESDEDGSHAVKIFDPPSDFALMHPSDLAANWSSAAIFVGSEPPSETFSAVQLAGTFCGVFLVLGLLNRGPRRFACITFTGGLMIAAASGVLLHSFSETGYFNGQGARLVEANFRSENRVPTARIHRVEDLGEFPMVVDARLPRDFENGAIPGAYNIPITSSYASLLAFAKENQPEAGTPVLVYCQSDRCEWGDRVAGILRVLDFGEPVVFRGGYQEYERMVEAESLSESGVGDEESTSNDT